MAELIENPKLAGARMLQSGLQGAASLYGQLQQVKAERERLDEAKVQARYEAGMRLLTDPKLPASIKAKAYNSGVRPYIEKFSPGESLDLTEADFQGGDIQSLIDEVSPIWNSKDYSAEDKRALMSVPFAKWQSRFGLNKEAASTLMGGFGISDEPTKTPGSIDAILASRVQSGELTLEQAIQMKAQSSPQSFQVIGTQGGVPVAVNPKTLETRPVSLPGAGPLLSTTQNEAQANAALFAKRVEDANASIDRLGGATDLTSIRSATEGKLPNVAKSSNIQQFEQAKRNFVNAVLRRESGAAISASEFSEANKQYFPQFGDSKEVLDQKRLNRITAIEGLYNAAGVRKEVGQAQGQQSGPSKVASDADYNALPPGATFVGPDGKLRRKP
jgi:hypothetical protein